MGFASARKMLLLRSLKACGRAAVTATLCALLVEQPLLAEAPPAARATSANTAAVAAGQMPQEERVLHALNRLTFGPRPGDVAAVSAMGLNQWFELQLNPGRIDDSKLDAMLQQYPGYFLSTEQMEQKFPSPAMLKLMENGRIPLPADPAQRAIAMDQVAFYRIYKAKQAKGAAAGAGVKDASGVKDSAGLQDASGVKEASGGSDASENRAGAMQGDAPQMLSRKGRREGAAPGAATGDMDGGGAKMDVGKAMAADADPVSRLGFARNSYPKDKVEAILGLPPEARYRAVLALEPMDAIRFETSLGKNGPARLAEGMNPAEREKLIALTGSVQMVALEASEARLMRDVYSDRQLEAVMTDFWLNHFNVYARKNQFEPYLLSAYERETIRPNALGNFETLLVATAKSPAMLTYLDNYKSVGADSQQARRIERVKERFPDNNKVGKANSGLNENYGRELMELHTLGVNGGYTQADVTTMAKVFTGWTLDKPYAGGEFRFDENKHEPGAKTLLGVTVREGGEKEGLEMLHVLATSPATARFISEKLAVRFVSDTPPPALVDRMAASFLASRGDIKTVLRTMFEAPEFWSAEVYRAKLKTPEEFVVSALRASGAQVRNAAPLVQSLGILGMPLYGMQTPNGYSWTKDGWLNTGALVARMNFSLVMSDDRMRGTDTVWPELLGENKAGVVPAAYVAENGMTDEAKERNLEQILIGRAVSEQTRKTVLMQANDGTITEQAATNFDLNGAGKKGAGKLNGRARGMEGEAARIVTGRVSDPRAAVMAGLLLGSPEFQKR